MFKEIIMAENAGFCFGVKRAVDDMIVVGSKTSSNTTKLYEICL